MMPETKQLTELEQAQLDLIQAELPLLLQIRDLISQAQGVWRESPTKYLNGGWSALYDPLQQAFDQAIIRKGQLLNAESVIKGDLPF